MKKLVVLMSVIGILVSLAACNTVQGMGKDIERGGEALQRISK